ncbi:hypothetical protein ACHAWF_006800 [Thalassiosira exigua]
MSTDLEAAVGAASPRESNFETVSIDGSVPDVGKTGTFETDSIASDESSDRSSSACGDKVDRRAPNQPKRPKAFLFASLSIFAVGAALALGLGVGLDPTDSRRGADATQSHSEVFSDRPGLEVAGGNSTVGDDNNAFIHFRDIPGTPAAAGTDGGKDEVEKDESEVVVKSAVYDVDTTTATPVHDPVVDENDLSTEDTNAQKTGPCARRNLRHTLPNEGVSHVGDVPNLKGGEDRSAQGLHQNNGSKARQERLERWLKSAMKGEEGKVAGQIQSKNKKEMTENSVKALRTEVKGSSKEKTKRGGVEKVDCTSATTTKAKTKRASAKGAEAAEGPEIANGEVKYRGSKRSSANGTESATDGKGQAEKFTVKTMSIEAMIDPDDVDLSLSMSMGV